MVLLIAKNFQLVKFSQVDFRIKKPASHSDWRGMPEPLSATIFTMKRAKKTGTMSGFLNPQK